MKATLKACLFMAVSGLSITVSSEAGAQTNTPTPLPGTDSAPAGQQTSTQAPAQDQATTSTAPTAATAATAPTTRDVGLGEIVVTAQRRSENLQRVPVAVTALNPRALATANVASTADLVALTPGLNFNTNLGGFGQPRIRGIGTTATGPGIENPVATYVDGVYIATSAGALFSLNDVEQVAILKGPQGTLFGRNATGGLVQVTTRAPSMTPEAEVQVGLANYATSSANAYVTGGLTDTISASVAALYEDQNDGFGKNLYNGRDVQAHRTGAARAKLQWKPDEKTKVTLSGDYNQYNASDPAIRTFGLRDSVFPPFAPGEPTPGGKRDIDLDVQPHLKSQQYGGSLSAQRDFGGVQLLSITAYRHSSFQTAFDADQTPYRDATAAAGQSELEVSELQVDRQLSQELQLQSTSTGRFKWVAGAFYFHSVSRYDPITTEGPFLHLFTPAFPLDAVSTYVDQRLNSYAGYAQGTYELARSTNFTAGLRYTSDHRYIDQSQTLTVAGFPVDEPAEIESKTFNKLTWRLALDHQFTPDILGYVSYNRGFKSGSFAPNTVPVLTLKPETLDAYEVGLKTELFDRRVRFNIAGYYYDQKNLQVNQILQGVLNVYNASGARSYGVDADLQARVTPQFTLIAGASYVHDRYKSFTNAFALFPKATGGDSVVTGYDATGNRLQNTPDYTLNVGGTYDVPTPIGKFTLAANFYRNGGYYADPQNRVQQKAYNLLDASLSWFSKDDHLTIRVWAKNLNNAFYVQQTNPTDFGDNYVAAPPRTFGVTGGFKF